MSRELKSLILGLGMILACSAGWADILYLKSGDSLEGTVTQEAEDSITFQIEGGKIQFTRVEIDRIERTGARGKASPRQAVESEHFTGTSYKPSFKERMSGWFGKKQGRSENPFSSLASPQPRGNRREIIAMTDAWSEAT